MTRVTFISETFTKNELQILQFDDYVEISITNSDGKVMAVHLTVSDAEQFIDEIHHTLINIEGGEDGIC